jgi:hypothetical protein
MKCLLGDIKLLWDCWMGLSWISFIGAAEGCLGRVLSRTAKKESVAHRGE